MVKAQSEQYVYFDNTIGRNATVTVSVGEEVSVGQQLVQYDSTSAQEMCIRDRSQSVPLYLNFKESFDIVNNVKYDVNDMPCLLYTSRCV